MTSTLLRPAQTEYLPNYERYVSLVPDGFIVDILRHQSDEFFSFYQDISEAKSTHRYAPDKWSIRQVMGHMIDTERVFNFRALAISRGEQQALPGFEQDDYVAASNFDERPWADLVNEFTAVRVATVKLFDSMSDAMIARTGTVWKGALSARACGFIIAGHERYHVKGLKERYL